MKRLILLVVIAGLSAALAGQFLAVVPNAKPDDLARTFKVVGQTGNGVLVTGDDARSAALSSVSGRVLASNPDEHAYYSVRLFDPTTRSEIAQVSRILDFDGEEYLVEINPADVERLMGLRVMLGRVSLRGWRLNDATPQLPKVLSDPAIEAIVANVNPDSILAAVRRMQNYKSRYSTGDSARACADWIRQKFIDYGCDSTYLQNHTSGHAPNVIGIKHGTAGQRQPYAIIDGHFDSYASTGAPGADDNASGTVSAIEACRAMQDFRFTHDLRFIAFSGEEFGLYGSDYYAAQARSAGDSILGVLNFDMIGYEDAVPEDLDVLGKIASPACEPFVDWFTAVADTYAALPIYKQMVSDNQNSDMGPFWNEGYLAFCGIEDFWPTNPHYHTSHDSIGAGYNSNEFCTQTIRAAVAALALLGEPIPSNTPLVGISGKRLTDATGNNDGFWDAGESVAVYVTLKNFGMVAAHNVSAVVSTSDPYVTVYNNSATYGDIAGLDTAAGSAPYTMLAAAGTPREHIAEFDLAIIAVETTWHTTFSFQVGRYLATDPVPDGPRTPPCYWAYDDVDSAYAQHPTYSWVEVRSLGTRIPYPNNDDVITVSLPAGFGPFKYYGQRYTQLSVSADGWIAPGSYTTSNYSNTALPSTSAPPGVICANWDDLYPNRSGSDSVYYFHDAANHRFIVEFDSVSYYSSSTTRDKFEFIFYDTTLASPSGDNVIEVQYKTAAGYASSTVGIQDPGRTIAIQCLYNTAYTHGAAPVVPGRAIKYTTDAPTAVAESGTVPDAPRLALEQNPVRGDVRVRFALRQASNVKLEAFDRAGRKVTILVAQSSGTLEPGLHTATWNAACVAPGVYFIRLTAEGTSRTVKAVVSR